MTGIKEGSQNARILAALASGRWRTVAAIHRDAGFSRLNSRISELRAHGYRIEHRHNHGPNASRGSLQHSYRWLDAPGLPDLGPSQGLLPQDERVPEERFRLYTVCNGERTLIATCPDEECVGSAIVTLAREGAFTEPGCSLGILDTHGQNEKPGEWLLNPWNSKVV